uniref:Dynamin-type G domain-containing protein n=2 Tax=Haptolina brevifila TaxID=156173 RepID=A0A7S2IE09_9EUKA
MTTLLSPRGRLTPRSTRRPNKRFTRMELLSPRKLSVDLDLEKVAPAPSLMREAETDKTLSLIESARGLLVGCNINLPGIVVVGSQNAGKSALLEALSGIRFPRGDGLVTRCPITVFLEVDETISQPMVTVASDPEFTSDDRVDVKLGDERPAIDAAMNAAANGQDFSDTVVYVRVVRSAGPTFCITDLPGITSISSAASARGDRSGDIEAQTIALTRRWCESPGVIIVCVLQALDDFHNSQALRVALEADPMGSRTLGVVTKVDLLPTTGEFASKMNAERPTDIKLPGHGLLAVCGKPPSSSGALAERSLFATHPQLACLRPDQWGMETLAQRLVAIQRRIVSQDLSRVTDEVGHHFEDVRRSICEMPPRTVSNEQKQRLLSQAIGASSIEFYELCMAMDTCYTREMHVAARTQEKCEAFSAQVEARVPDFLSDELRDEIADQLGESTGVYLNNFIHGNVFRRLVKQHFERPLAEESEALVTGVVEIVKHVLKAILHKSLGSAAISHERLADKLTASAHSLVDEEMKAALRATAEIVCAEMRSPFTQDALYGTTMAIFERFVFGDASSSAESNGLFPASFLEAASVDCKADRADVHPAATNAANVRKLQTSLHIYKQILLRRTSDMIPMLVRERLLFSLQDRLAPDMLLDHSLLAAHLYEEPQHVTDSRVEAERLEQKLKLALEKLTLARDSLKAH